MNSDANTYRLRMLVAGILLFALTVLAYAKVVAGPFLFDDILYVVNRPHSHLPDLSWNSISDLLAVEVSQPHRWLSHLSFALNFYFFGDSPASFHVVNIIIHLLTTLGVFLLARTSFVLLNWSPHRAGIAAMAAAAVFALHPIQTQAVSYIWQRTASLVTCWTVYAVWFYALARSHPIRQAWWRYFPAVLCFVAPSSPSKTASSSRS